MGAAEVSRFLSALAVEGRVSASTQNQALAALLFLYRRVLGVDLPWLDDLVRAARPHRLPVVLSREEVRAVLLALRGTVRLICVLLYGSGLRLLEGARLRVKDLDFRANQITVRCGKGDRDRVSLLPATAQPALQTSPRAGTAAALPSHSRPGLIRKAATVLCGSSSDVIAVSLIIKCASSTSCLSVSAASSRLGA